ncbi:hypothetical protein [Flavobacterium lindanitolerans]|uniref:hypothetical protein n=1 Tax=Flavobacterium lindanitolerans TaxID=428988 RepID=UPI0027B9BBEC|nr:hypothetical protein [Flavobacterium lindanitolerans]
MKSIIDDYSLRARFYPSLIVLLPAFVVAIFYITDIEKYYHYFTALCGLGLFSYILAQLGRDRGKKKEPDLFVAFGGKPTTQIMRYRDTHLNRISKDRYRSLLEQMIPNLTLPTQTEENNDPKAADEIYDSCAKFLISKTRDNQKYYLLYKENTSYGFRRNLWAMKGIAITIILVVMAIHIYIATSQLKDVNNCTNRDLFLTAFLIFAICMWVFVVTKNWVKMIAFSYAERLFETLIE